MAKDIVDAVHQVEMKAAQIEKDAAKERDSIILKAQQDAEEMAALMVNEAVSRAEAVLKQAQLQGEDIIKTAVQKAEQEILDLREAIGSREKAAIDLVISEVA